MKKLALSQIDAFTDSVFGGNPAAVCPLDTWLPDEILQKIAMENNLSETAFFVPENQGFRLRWFTPLAEVDLCGHATLAAAFAMFELRGYTEDIILFETRSGPLTVTRGTHGLTMDFPQWTYENATEAETAKVEKIVGLKSHAVLKNSAVWTLVFNNIQTVKAFKPDIPAIKTLQNVIGLLITAPGEKGTDFVSRFFAPQVGIDEDPVTGSTHCLLAPYWSKILGKTEMSAKQVSPRGGNLQCKITDAGRVEISGNAALYMEGNIYVNAG